MISDKIKLKKITN